MRVFLLYAPYHHKAFEENIRTVSNDFGVLPPLNLAYAAALFREAGCEVRLMDANALRSTGDEVLKEARAFGPDLLGTYVSTYMFHETREWLGFLKQNLGLPVVAGGINLRLYPRETLSWDEFDYGIIGSGQRSIRAFCRAFESHADMSGIPGVAYKQDGNVIIQPPEDDEQDFAGLPLPARDLLPRGVYQSIVSQLQEFTVMLTSTGCNRRCSFCPIWRNPLQFKPVDAVLMEFEHLVKDLLIREVDIFDADMGMKPARLRAVAEGLLDRGLSIDWSCRMSIGRHLTADLLNLIARAGCRRIFVGIESADTEKLHRGLNKVISPEEVKRVLNDAVDAGIRPLGFFMTGLPGETWSSMMATARLAASLPLDYAQFSRLIPKPGTVLAERIARETGVDYWREYILGNVPERRIGSPWTGLTEKEIEIGTKLAYYMFYFRPRILYRTFRDLRSPKELFKYARTTIRMVSDMFYKDREDR